MNLCNPIRIESMELPHRMIMPAMWVRTAENGFVTDQTKIHYEERAKGKPSLIIVGACTIERMLDREWIPSTWATGAPNPAIAAPV